jgi:putative restriction endonuclease
MSSPSTKDRPSGTPSKNFTTKPSFCLAIDRSGRAGTCSKSDSNDSWKRDNRVRAFVAVTDRDWYRFLLGRPDLDEVNFWRPRGGHAFRAVQPGEPFLFKLHYPENAIVGGGTFVWFTSFPLSIAWEAFEEKNGAATLVEMRARIERYRKIRRDRHEDYLVGCLILEDPFFFAEPDWIPTPPDWSRNIVQGKTYDLESVVGRRLWDEVLLRRQTAWARRQVEPMAPMFGDPVLVRQRLGQGSFRLLVMDSYQRRCAVTHEKALPVLQAAHIRPVSEGGRHLISNGLLLRSDVHALFDRGYVTVTPSLQFKASRRLRDEFDNGEEYFGMEGRELWLPRDPADRPDPDFLEWHSDVVFLK